jgi:two-component sensor histidine kinase
MTGARETRFERLLGSLGGRALLTVSLVIVVSLVTTAPHVETADLRGRNVDLFDIYLEQLTIYGAWGVLIWPLLWVARRLLSRSMLLFLLAMAPLSLATAFAFLELDYYVHRPTEEEVEEWRQEMHRARDPLRLGGSPPDGSGSPPAGPPGPPRQGGRPGRGGRWGDPGVRGAEERSIDRQSNRWRAMRAGMERPNLSVLHWRFRWIQNGLIFWSLLGLGGGLASFLGLRRKERLTAELELRSSELRGELAQAHLDTLKGQLQPHFLFNSLHSVGGLIRADEPQLALRTLSAIGELLRSTLDLDGTAEIRLADELQIAERYIEVEKIRFGDRLSFELDIEPELRDAFIPTLLLLPLVENAVKYGISEQLTGGVIRVAGRRLGEVLELVVSDDGPGFRSEVLADGAGSGPHQCIGLQNTRGRLEALYGNGQELELRNRPEGGAEIVVKLPWHEQPTDLGGESAS